MSRIPSDFTSVYVYEIANFVLRLTHVVTDLCRRFSKTFADCKNIAGNGQTTLMVDKNSANIVYTFLFYVCLRLRDCDWCSPADGIGSCHGIAPSFCEEMIRCQRQKYCRRWPISIEIAHLPKYMPMRSSKTSRNTSFLLLWCYHYDAIAHCFFPTITRNGFCFRLGKINSRWPWPQQKTKIYMLKSFL